MASDVLLVLLPRPWRRGGVRWVQKKGSRSRRRGHALPPLTRLGFDGIDLLRAPPF